MHLSQIIPTTPGKEDEVADFSYRKAQFVGVGPASGLRSRRCGHSRQPKQTPGSTESPSLVAALTRHLDQSVARTVELSWTELGLRSTVIA